MSTNLREHLLATIAHLNSRRVQHLNEADRLNGMIQQLRNEEEGIPRTELLAFPPNQGEYAGISIRWAIFLFLGEHSEGPQTLGNIADALRAGGATTKAQSFNSNVSAVLSQMGGKNEIAKVEDKFALTLHGSSVWAGIKRSEKFLSCQESAPSGSGE